MPSEPVSVRRWLTDIRHHLVKTETFMAGISYDAFLEDDLRFYAVTRCLEIISEASRRLPDELKSRHPAIAWSQMASAGNIYRHEYDQVAVSFVWQTVAHSLPLLRKVIDAEMAALDDPT